MSSSSQRQNRSRSRSRDRGNYGNKDFSKMNKHERREEMKKESSDKQVWGHIAREEDELYDKEKGKMPEEEKEKANFGLSGALAKDEVTGNMVNGKFILQVYSRLYGNYIYIYPSLR